MQINIVTNYNKKVHNNKSSEDFWIDGILNNDSKVLTQIYNENFNKIKVMVLNFKNIQIDPQDVFQEGLTRAVVNIRQNKFKQESQFSTYLFSICRNICLKEYNRQAKQIPSQSNFDFDEEHDHYFELLKFVLKIKSHIDKKCIEIIDLRFNLNRDQNETRFENISERMGISIDNARQRFKRCLSKLMKLVNAHPEYKTLFD
mgnify:CR=1 FL=1